MSSLFRLIRVRGVNGVSNNEGKAMSLEKSARTLYGGYFRALYLSRLSLAAFWAAFVYFLVWAVPWFPGGLSREDYTREFAVTLAFGGCCMLLGLISATFTRTARHRREAIVAWSSLYDETTGLHNRSHFYDRLSLECERCRRHGSPFTFLLLKLTPLTGRADVADMRVLQAAARLVKGLTRSTDLVALVSKTEFAVLLLDMDKVQAELLTGRIKETVTSRLPGLISGENAAVWLHVEVGMSTFSEESTTPDGVIEAARAALCDTLESGPMSARAAA